jgi:hypothetical protein
MLIGFNNEKVTELDGILGLVIRNIPLVQVSIAVLRIFNTVGEVFSFFYDFFL